MANPWNRLIKNSISNVFGDTDVKFYTLYEFGYKHEMSKLLDQRYMHTIDGDVTFYPISLYGVNYVIFKQNIDKQKFPKIQFVQFKNVNYHNERTKTITHNQIRDLTDFEYQLKAIKHELDERKRAIELQKKKDDIARRKYEIEADNFDALVEDLNNKLIELDSDIEVVRIYDDLPSYRLDRKILAELKSVILKYKTEFEYSYKVELAPENCKLNITSFNSNLFSVSLDEKYIETTEKITQLGDAISNFVYHYVNDDTPEYMVKAIQIAYEIKCQKV
ncbi:MAG: hypothetical protein J6T10_19445 [Methanobrevibacter sp.]|nr:hypothetical protein [Methanobrevibacter sp.]